jgi:ribosomal-protein-alanine N-acetyltransferase
MTISPSPQFLHELEHAGLALEAGHWSERDYVSELASEHSKIFYISEPVEGFVLYRIVAGDIEIMNLAVRQKGRGHGRSLLEAFLVSPFVLSSGRKIFLEVASSNVAARKLYGRVGFSETGLRPAYYRSGEDAVTYVLELPHASP